MRKKGRYLPIKRRKKTKTINSNLSLEKTEALETYVTKAIKVGSCINSITGAPFEILQKKVDVVAVIVFAIIPAR